MYRLPNAPGAGNLWLRMADRETQINWQGRSMTSRLLTVKLTLVIATLLAVTALSLGQDPTPTTKPIYVRTGYEATISGTITLTGKRPKERSIDASPDPICTEVNPDLTTEWAVGQKGKLANVFVYVKSDALAYYAFEQPDAIAILEHKGCRYAPHLLGIRTGQLLTIVNSDPTQHNTHPTPKMNPEWNQTQPEGGPPLTKTFKHAETFIPFKCNQHPWEKAYVGVFDHPFFAISDESGNYRMEGLPPGHYTVVAWHERFGEKTVDVQLVAGEARAVSFDFDAEKDSAWK